MDAKSAMSHTKVKHHYAPKDWPDDQTLLTLVEQHGLETGPTASRRQAQNQPGTLVRGMVERNLILRDYQRRSGAAVDVKTRE